MPPPADSGISATQHQQHQHGTAVVTDPAEARAGTTERGAEAGDGVAKSYASAPAAPQQQQHDASRMPQLPHVKTVDTTTRSCSPVLQDSQQQQQPSTPNSGSWRSRMFTTAGRQQQQMAPPALPPGCLMLDGEALLWDELEDENSVLCTPQLLAGGAYISSDGGGSSNSRGGMSRSGSSRLQPQSSMRTSASSPNLVMLVEGGGNAEGSNDSSSSSDTTNYTAGTSLQQQQQGFDGGLLQPMHSSQSCDSLLSLCQQQGQGGAPALLMPGQQLTSTTGAVKSRLGRPTSHAGVSQATQQQSLGGTADLVQQQQQQLGQQVFDFLPDAAEGGGAASGDAGASSSGRFFGARSLPQAGSGRPRYQMPPTLAVGSKSGGGGSTGSGVTSASSSMSVAAAGGGAGSMTNSTWAFSRCNSGLSMASSTITASEALRARRLRVHCVTFNMNGKLPSSLPPELLGDCVALIEGQQQQQSQGVGAGAGAAGAEEEDADSSGRPPDLLVFATQENGYISEWERLLGGVLSPSGYERLAWHSLRAIHLVLFANRRFRRQVLDIHGSAVATGIGNLVGNKGAVALSVELLDSKLLFISSHLAAHGDQVQQRNADYLRIKAGLFAAGADRAAGTPTTPRSATLARGASPFAGGGGGSGEGCTPKTRRRSLQLQRPPMSAPSAARSSMSECGISTAGGGSSGSGGGSGFSAWTGFLRSNRVVPVSDVYADSPNASTPRKRVSWWVEASSDGTPLSVQPTTPSAGQLGAAAMHNTNSSTTAVTDLADHDAAVASQLTRLRTASCPVLEHPSASGQQQQQEHDTPGSAAAGTDRTGGGGGGSSSFAATTTSGNTTPVCGDSLSASAAAALTYGSGGGMVLSSSVGDMSSGGSFLRSLMGKQQPGRSRPVDVLEAHDAVFWLGDLNYRINGNAKAVRHLMRSRLHEVLHANDQLRLQQKLGTVFQGFQEGRIRFPPTFKFLPGSSAYSEKRVPSWTDRVLWRVRGCGGQQQQTQTQQQQQQQQQQSDKQPPVRLREEDQLFWASDGGEINTPIGVGGLVSGASSATTTTTALPGCCDDSPPPSVTLLYYSSVPEVVSSDHKPVVAGFEVVAAAAAVLLRDTAAGGEDEGAAAGDRDGGGCDGRFACSRPVSCDDGGTEEGQCDGVEASLLRSYGCGCGCIMM